jgi:PPP family 3-phenylpropionic acid transporter
MMLTTAAAHGLPRPIALGRREAEAAPSAPRLSVAGAAGLLRSRIFLVFLAASGLTQAAHAVFYTFGTLHWRDLGLSTGWSGALWAISIVAEVVLFAYSAAVVRSIGAAGLIVVGAGAAVIRWLAMGFDPPLALLVPLQLLHALTFGATHLGAMHFIGHAVPRAQAGTAQALYASVTSGIAMGGAMLISGPLYAAYAGRAYWAMAAVGLLALAASLALLKTQPRWPCMSN